MIGARGEDSGETALIRRLSLHISAIFVFVLEDKILEFDLCFPAICCFQ